MTGIFCRSLYVKSRLSKEGIANKIGVPEYTVKRELERHGITLPKMLGYLASIYSRKDIEQVYVNEGLVQIEAAKKLGISLRNFKGLLRHFEITHRHHGIPNTFYQIEVDDLERMYVANGRI